MDKYSKFRSQLKNALSGDLSCEEFLKGDPCQQYLKEMSDCEDVMEGVGGIEFEPYKPGVGKWGYLTENEFHDGRTSYVPQITGIKLTKTPKEGIVSPILASNEDDERRVEYRALLSLKESGTGRFVSPLIVEWDYETEEVNLYPLHEACIKFWKFNPENLEQEVEAQKVDKFIYEMAAFDYFARTKSKNAINDRVFNQITQKIYKKTKRKPKIMIKDFFEERKEEIVNEFNSILRGTYETDKMKHNELRVRVTALNDWMKRFEDYSPLREVDDLETYTIISLKNLDSKEHEIFNETISFIKGLEKTNSEIYDKCIPEEVKTVEKISLHGHLMRPHLSPILSFPTARVFRKLIERARVIRFLEENGLENTLSTKQLRPDSINEIDETSINTFQSIKEYFKRRREKKKEANEN